MSSWSARLRQELSSRASAYASKRGVDWYQSLGKSGTTLFPPSADGQTHGNFAEHSFNGIRGNATWSARLRKPHPGRGKSLPPPHDTTAAELDSCTSSDALLMNVFCYPGVVAGEIAALLEVPPGATPAFGVDGRVPHLKRDFDTTELDMQIGGTNFEAKLTESTFTTSPIANVEKYVGLYETFDRAALPREGEEYLGYQLIRNVLAIATKPESRFKVIIDGRRPDLLREWWSVYGAISSADVRKRCGFILWQEIAAASPAPLREFLAVKYGL